MANDFEIDYLKDNYIHLSQYDAALTRLHCIGIVYYKFSNNQVHVYFG